MKLRSKHRVGESDCTSLHLAEEDEPVWKSAAAAAFVLRSVSGESCERGARAMPRRHRRGNAASFCSGAGGEGRERERAAAADRGEL